MINPATLLNPDKAFFTRGVIQSDALAPVYVPVYVPVVVTKSQVSTIGTSGFCASLTAATIDALVQDFAEQKSMPVVDTNFLSIHPLSSREYAVKTFIFDKNILGAQPTITEGETHKVCSKLSQTKIEGRTLSSSTGLPFILKFFTP